MSEKHLQDAVMERLRAKAALGVQLADALLNAPPGHSYRGVKFGPPNSHDWKMLIALARKVKE